MTREQARPDIDRAAGRKSGDDADGLPRVNGFSAAKPACPDSQRASANPTVLTIFDRIGEIIIAVISSYSSIIAPSVPFKSSCRANEIRSQEEICSRLCLSDKVIERQKDEDLKPLLVKSPG
jgi:hypothetical protein